MEGEGVEEEGEAQRSLLGRTGGVERWRRGGEVVGERVSLLRREGEKEGEGEGERGGSWECRREVLGGKEPKGGLEGEMGRSSRSSSRGDCPRGATPPSPPSSPNFPFLVNVFASGKTTFQRKRKRKRKREKERKKEEGR